MVRTSRSPQQTVPNQSARPSQINTMHLVRLPQLPGRVHLPKLSNLVFYNLISACSSLCLYQGIIRFDQWTDQCQDVRVTDDYPFKNREDFEIPGWARVPLTSSGVFNTEAAFSSASIINSWRSGSPTIPSAAYSRLLTFLQKSTSTGRPYKNWHQL